MLGVEIGNYCVQLEHVLDGLLFFYLGLVNLFEKFRIDMMYQTTV